MLGLKFIHVNERGLRKTSIEYSYRWQSKNVFWWYGTNRHKDAYIYRPDEHWNPNQSYDYFRFLEFCHEFQCYFYQRYIFKFEVSIKTLFLGTPYSVYERNYSHCLRLSHLYFCSASLKLYTHCCWTSFCFNSNIDMRYAYSRSTGRFQCH